jgi:hypothetical protein
VHRRLQFFLLLLLWRQDLFFGVNAFVHGIFIPPVPWLVLDSLTKPTGWKSPPSATSSSHHLFLDSNYANRNFRAASSHEQLLKFQSNWFAKHSSNSLGCCCGKDLRSLNTNSTMCCCWGGKSRPNETRLLNFQQQRGNDLSAS